MKKMKHFRRRGLALLLALVMCLGTMQITAFADESDSSIVTDDNGQDTITDNDDSNTNTVGSNDGYDNDRAGDDGSNGNDSAGEDASNGNDSAGDDGSNSNDRAGEDANNGNNSAGDDASNSIVSAGEDGSNNDTNAGDTNDGADDNNDEGNPCVENDYVDDNSSFATVEELTAAFDAYGGTDDVDSGLAALDAVLAVFARLSPEDQAAYAEMKAQALAQRDILMAAKEAGENGSDENADPKIKQLIEDGQRTKKVTIVKTFVGKNGNKLTPEQIPEVFVLNYSYTYGGQESTGSLTKDGAVQGTNNNGHPTLTWELDVPVDADTSSTNKTPLTITETGYTVDGYTWEKQSGLNSGDEKAVSGTYQINATENLPTNYINNYYSKNAENPELQWTVKWMKGYGEPGELPWEEKPDTEPVKTQTYLSGGDAPQVPEDDYPTTEEMSNLRDDSHFIGWGEPVVDEESRTITITAKWETTVSHNIGFYKSLKGVEPGDGVANDFQMKITITDLLTGAQLAEDTFTKQHINTELRIYFDYVVEHGYKITIVESNYEIEGYTFKSSATQEEITEAESTPAYFQGMISGSSGTHTVINTYEKNPEPIKYKVSYTWTGLPENYGQTPPADEFYTEGTLVNVDTEYTSKKTVTVDGITYTFSGWNKFTEGVSVSEKNTFTMPGKDVVIEGTWIKTAVPPTPMEIKVMYLVQWLDKDSGKAVKPEEVRGPGKVGDTVAVIEKDMIIEGYTFVSDYKDNVVQDTLKKISGQSDVVILKLYFTKDEEKPEKKDVAYTVVHEYYTNKSPAGSIQISNSGKVGEVVNATGIVKIGSYGGNDYTYGSASPESITLTEGGQNIITLRYYRTTGGRRDPEPTPTPTRRNPDPTTEPDPDPSTDPAPNPTTAPSPIPSLVPGVPTVDILGNNVPLTNLPDEDVPLAGTPGKAEGLEVDIFDEEVPLSDVPRTGDISDLWYLAALLSAGMLIFLGLRRKNHR